MGKMRGMMKVRPLPLPHACPRLPRVPAPGCPANLPALSLSLSLEDPQGRQSEELTWLSTSADFGAGLAFVQDADNLCVSLGSASNNAALLTIFSKATMQTTVTGTLSGVGEVSAPRPSMTSRRSSPPRRHRSPLPPARVTAAEIAARLAAARRRANHISFDRG